MKEILDWNFVVCFIARIVADRDEDPRGIVNPVSAPHCRLQGQSLESFRAVMIADNDPARSFEGVFIDDHDRDANEAVVCRELTVVLQVTPRPFECEAPDRRRFQIFVHGSDFSVGGFELSIGRFSESGIDPFLP